MPIEAEYSMNKDGEPQCKCVSYLLLPFLFSTGAGADEGVARAGNTRRLIAGRALRSSAFALLCFPFLSTSFPSAGAKLMGSPWG